MRRLKFVADSASGVIQFSITGILIFVSIPLFIKFLGNEKYGVFSLVTVVGNLNIFSNLGLNTSLIKFVAEQGKCDESDHDILVTVSLISILTVPLTLLAIYFSDYLLLNLLKIPDGLLEEGKYLLISLLFANFFLLTGQTFTAVLDATNRVYVTNVLQLIYSVLYWGLIIIVLLLGYALKMVGLVILFSTLVWVLLVVSYTFKTWGPIRLSGLKINYVRIAKKQLFYGSKIYSAGMLMFFGEPLVKVLISNLIGINEVAYYDIALKVKSVVWGLISKMVYPIFPLIAQLRNELEIKDLVNRSEQKILYFVIPLFASVYFCTESFIRLWLPAGAIIPVSISVIYITICYLLGIVVLPNYYYLLTKDKTAIILILQGSNIIVNSIVIVISYNYLGFYSVILGSALAIIFSLFFSLYYQYKYLDTFIIDSWQMAIKLLAVLISLFTLDYFTAKQLSSDWYVLIVIPLVNFVLATIFYKKFNLLKLDGRLIFAETLTLFVSLKKYVFSPNESV